MAKVEFQWRNGTHCIGEGDTPEQAFTNAGFCTDDLPELDYYEKVDDVPLPDIDEKAVTALAALRHVAIVGEPAGAVRELLEAMDAEHHARYANDMFYTRSTFDEHRDTVKRLAAARARFTTVDAACGVEEGV